ncbi:MAG: RimK/LysX family protein [Balneola sp.]|tara:strand:- start:154189 stop:154626 length:438 start_codon:yes stop_codon:yes gene_type:complete
MKKMKKEIIGRLETVDLPTWNIKEIEAKIDTGAYSSSLHCHNIEEFEKNDKNWVRFNLLDPDHPSYNDRLFSLPVLDSREVKSSNGQTELRVFIETKISFFGVEYPIELSLTNRSEMKYPLLIGRKFLRKKFLVDVSKKNLSKTI